MISCLFTGQIMYAYAYCIAIVESISIFFFLLLEKYIDMDLFYLNMVSVIYKGIVISPGENSPVHILHVDIEQGQLL